MFTGLIEEMGRIDRSIAKGKEGATLVIACRRVLEDLKVGDSISVSGVCVTVTSLGSGVFSADVMPETIRKTTLGDLRSGDRVNLERALRADARLGGHLLTGHVDGVGVISKRRAEGNSERVVVRCPNEVLKYLAPKGSVAVDGVSLTLAEVSLSDGTFTVYLIPHTAAVTTLGSKPVSSRVNLEADLIGKYVWQYLNAFRTAAASDSGLRSGSSDTEKTGSGLQTGTDMPGSVSRGITEQFLREHGFDV
ncbi:MAG TPA: riboflavin synthase [Clostridia bacterium]|nr:riboflavin synthase [Clostridia bacterium]